MAAESTRDEPRRASTPLRVATWNMDHWKRQVGARRLAWSALETMGVDIALLQETVAPAESSRERLVYRPIGGSRPWGNAVASFRTATGLAEVQTVQTRYGSRTFSMLGSIPGTIVVAQAAVDGLGKVTFVSVYGLIDVYSQTTMLRIVADLIPLFDSVEGEHVVLGGDFNISTSNAPSTRERPRYEAVLTAVEALGLVNLCKEVDDRPLAPTNCPCGDAPCKHVSTFRGGSDGVVGAQLDYLYATPALARRCQRIWLADEVSVGLSDHVPLVAEFSTAEGLARNVWNPTSFARELAARQGARAGEVAQEIIAWCLSKHAQLRLLGSSRAALDRLPISTGPDPELWIQLDLRRPDSLQYTCSLRTSGEVVVQFQYMRAPFDTEEARRKLLAEFAEIPGVALGERLNGRPTFALAALFPPERLAKFLGILDRLVDATVKWHATGPDGK